MMLLQTNILYALRMYGDEIKKQSHVAGTLQNKLHLK